MVKDRLSGKLAVILHADIAGSTQMVQKDEHLAHERIQDTFHRFSATIKKYSGQVLELRGDALLPSSSAPRMRYPQPWRFSLVTPNFSHPFMTI